MKRLSSFSLPRPSDWWIDTLVMLAVFVPLGCWFGISFVSDILKGELTAPGLTPLRYVIVLFPAATSFACFATVTMRLLGKPSAWLGCVSLMLVMTMFFLGMIVMMVVIAIVVLPTWAMILAILLAMGTIGLVALLVREWRRSNSPDT